jgi:hypothetical protein
MTFPLHVLLVLLLLSLALLIAVTAVAVPEEVTVVAVEETNVIATNIPLLTTTTTTTMMADDEIDMVKHHHQDTKDVIAPLSSATYIRSSGIKNEIPVAVQSSLVRNLQQQSCNVCNGVLYNITCRSGRDPNGNTVGTYKSQQNADTNNNNGDGMCYDQVCCSNNNGEDCCIDSFENSDSYGCETCAINSTVWDVAYCKYGKNTTYFGTYSGPGVYAKRICATETCCAPTIEDCCNANDEISVIFNSTIIVPPIIDENLSAGSIVGIIFGVILCIALVGTIVVMYLHQRKTQQASSSSTEYEQTTAVNDSKSSIPINIEASKVVQKHDPTNLEKTYHMNSTSYHSSASPKRESSPLQNNHFELNVTIPTTTTMMDDMSAVTEEPFSTYSKRSNNLIIVDCEPCVNGTVIHDTETIIPEPVEPFVPPSSAKC